MSASQMLVDVGLLGDVELNRLDPRLPQRLCRGPAGVEIAAAEQHPVPQLRQPPAGLEPQAPVAAADQHDLVAVHLFLSWVVVAGQA